MKLMGLMLAISLVGDAPASKAGSREADADGRGRLRVAAVQMRSSADLDANLARICDRIRACGERGARVAVFPECALTGYSAEAARAFTAGRLAEAERKIGEACRRAGLVAVVGTPVPDGSRLYNSAVVIGASGEVRERYHKMKPAEPWPTPGDHLSVFPVAGTRGSIIICHDERYPELVRLPVLAGARVVFYLSHESGLAQEGKIGPYRAQIQARAAENSVFIVQANAPANPDATGSHGQSRIVAPDGNLMGEASIFGEEITTADLDLARSTASNAARSLEPGPLGDWWKLGLKQVRIIE